MDITLDPQTVLFPAQTHNEQTVLYIQPVKFLSQAWLLVENRLSWSIVHRKMKCRNVSYIILVSPRQITSLKVILMETSKYLTAHLSHLLLEKQDLTLNESAAMILAL